MGEGVLLLLESFGIRDTGVTGGVACCCGGGWAGGGLSGCLPLGTGILLVLLIILCTTGLTGKSLLLVVA